MDYKIIMLDKNLKATARYSQEHQAVREFNRLKDKLSNGFVELWIKGKIEARHTKQEAKWIGWLW